MIISEIGVTGNLESNEENMRFKEKERKVGTICDLKKIKTRGDDGRVYIRINSKPYSSTSYKGLIEKLFDAFFGIHNSTVEEYFEIWMKFRTEYAVENRIITAKTVTENRYTWNRWYRDYPIAKIHLSELKSEDCEKHYLTIIKDGKLAKRKFNDIKSLMNMMLEHAIDVDKILTSNVSKATSSKYYTFYHDSEEKEPITEANRLDMVFYLWEWDDIYCYAILFSLYLPIRIGEIKGLKWIDVDENKKQLTIRRFVDEHNNVIDGTKSHRGNGMRKVPLTDEALEVIHMVRKFNGNGEYMFFQDNDSRPLSTVTYNRRLASIAYDLGFEYRSSHQMRFSVASILYKNGMPLPTLQLILGHTTLGMTLHYLRNIITDEQARKLASDALDVYGIL